MKKKKKKEEEEEKRKKKEEEKRRKKKEGRKKNELVPFWTYADNYHFPLPGGFPSWKLLRHPTEIPSLDSPTNSTK